MNSGGNQDPRLVTYGIVVLILYYVVRILQLYRSQLTWNISHLYNNCMITVALTCTMMMLMILFYIFKKFDPLPAVSVTEFKLRHYKAFILSTFLSTLLLLAFKLKFVRHAVLYDMLFLKTV